MIKRHLLILLLIKICLVLPVRGQNLFDKDDVLNIILRGPVAELLKDRGENPQYHSLTLNYSDAQQKGISVPLRIRVRGNFRRQKGNCGYPPLMLNFSDEFTRGTLFEGQDKIKLVMPCQGDKYVVREFLVYKMYNQVTPMSFRARLVKVTLEETDGKPRSYEPFFGILLEDENQMATRNGMVAIDRQLVRPEQTQPVEFLTMAVFQYLIANTDWSVQYRQNIKLIAADSLSKPYAVPYDFDHAGMVWAPYAKPAPELMMSSVRERRYRGYCLTDMRHFERAFQVFNELKEGIYVLYRDNALLDETYKKATIRFLDDFYKTISTPGKASFDFQYPCRAEGTGNVVIKGLKN
ncbi:MAG: hypothetical protein MUE95_14190 [Cyclobacteriaceae bacterium]|jgi:hypothetical protein|nr:hypothetical protein [Cyclobacteriaceae bacterium]